MADKSIGKFQKMASPAAERFCGKMAVAQESAQSWLSSKSFREYHLWITRQLWQSNEIKDNLSQNRSQHKNDNQQKKKKNKNFKTKKICKNFSNTRNSPSTECLDKLINNENGVRHVATTTKYHEHVNCRVESVDIFSESMTSQLKLLNNANDNCTSGNTSRRYKTYSNNSISSNSSSAISGNCSKFIWHSLLVLLHLVMYITTPCLASREGAISNCTFPSRWEGTWFISGYQHSIHIKGSQFGIRGRCMASDGDKYLIVDNKGCHRCLVIYEKHANVLQYKESECEGDNMYMDQSNPAAMPIRSSVLKTDHRAGAHPNLNGHSRLSSSDQYIMRSNDDINDCFCKEREALQILCDQIPGDALLYSLFKENAEPIKCPLKGPFTFTYNRGHGECRSPVSNIESCTEESRLLLSFQACHDIHGTESTVETLTCLADWKDGNSRYLVGLVTHNHAISNEERFRCFVYEKISSLMNRGSASSASLKDAQYKLAQSGDATCNGLENAEVGSRIMTLRNRPPDPRCDFPGWLKGPRHWHALKGNAGYIFHQSDGSMHITKANGDLETRALCGQINKNIPTEVMAVLNYTTGCKSGFMCMVFYRRDTHVAEIQMGLPASRLEDACAPDYFDILKRPFITLLASSSESQMCPLEGLYSLKGTIGPPYILQRHKRNHNNKGHSQHGHHHHEAHKRLNFRNPDEFSHIHGLSSSSIRIRRNVPLISSGTSLIAVNSQSISSQLTSSGLIEKISKPTTTSDGKIPIGQMTELNETQRNRRDTSTSCLNYMGRRQLLIGCTEPQPHLIEVRPQCTEDNEEVYSCHGSWTENGTVYIVTWHARAQHRICITYRPTEGKSAKLIIGDTCYRPNQKLTDHHLAANLTVIGKCGDTSAATSFRYNGISNWITIVFLSIFVVTYR